MKHLPSATNEIATLEVIECDCGYHMGIDSSFVDQVEDAFFDELVHCPSCQTQIDVREILGMEPLKVKVEVIRYCYSSKGIEVEANSLAMARHKAEEESGGYEFPSEKTAEYEADGWCLSE